jgi:hypothetical protein
MGGAYSRNISISQGVGGAYSVGKVPNPRGGAYPNGRFRNPRGYIKKIFSS